MEKWVTAPGDVFEFLLDNPWPISWAYILLAAVLVLHLFKNKPKLAGPVWMLALPAAWLAWQLVASLGTINSELTRPVLAHFTACVACFYLGLFFSANSRCLAWLLPALVGALVIVIAVGWQQHFGGLEQTRRYFFLYLYPKMKEVPPEYLKKLSSTRIFSTLFYPNTLAGALLLLLPASLEFLCQARERFTAGARGFLVAAVGAGGLGCLYWSGSKGGWLLMLLLGLLWVLRLDFSRKLKQGLIVALLVLGLLGFIWKYAGFFEKGATSVGARFDYWAAALKSTLAHPLVGTGPGTFFITYQKLKRPESEMTRLAHNDYLQQASDSGLPGFLLYTAFIAAGLVLSFPSSKLIQTEPTLDSAISSPKAKRITSAMETETLKEAKFENSLWFAVWLGTLAWALQSLMEFALYLPALSWTAFTFLGLLLQRRFRIGPAG